MQFRGQANVPVVEPDHAVTLRHQLRAEWLGPEGQLGSEAHDEHDDLVRRVAPVFVGERDVADLGEALSGRARGELFRCDLHNRVLLTILNRSNGTDSELCQSARPSEEVQP
jgi:hypothetical protein